MDNELLKAKITESGLKKGFIAEQLGITRTGYRLKENGRNEFTASEIQTMRRLLNLSDREVRVIFLSTE